MDADTLFALAHAQAQQDQSAKEAVSNPPILFDPFAQLDAKIQEVEKEPKPRGKYAALTLQELYELPKITPKVKEYICEKEDFSKYSDSYCNLCCKIKTKTPPEIRIPISSTEVDVLIIQEHSALPGKYDRKEGQQEAINRDIITFICRKAGFAGLSFRLIQLLRCNPSAEDFPKGKCPSYTTMKACSPYLFKEIEQSRPKAIISLSTAVTKALGLLGVSNAKNRGEIIDNRYVLTIHPKALTMIRQNASGLYWGADFFNVIVNDFKKAAALARGSLSLPVLEQRVEEIAASRIKIAKSLQDVDDIVSEIMSLPENSIISFDTETTSLSGLTDDAKLLCIQFGWRRPSTGVIVSGVIPLWHRDNACYPAEQAWDRVVPVLTSNYGKVAHNGKFDILYIYFTTGVRVTNLAFDTMLLLHNINSGIQGCYGLKAAAWDYIPELGVSGYETLLPKLTTEKELEKLSKSSTTGSEETEVLDSTEHTDLSSEFNKDVDAIEEVTEEFSLGLNKNLDIDPDIALKQALDK